jgi:predicted metal-dependent phosphoesterase TrpH
MRPPEIAVAAIEAGLDLIAICDHNSAGNAAAVQEVALGPGQGLVRVLAGIEITTAEEVHLLGIFPDARAAGRVADAVRATLPQRTERARGMGRQCLLDYRGEELGEEPGMLSMASRFTLADAVDLVRGAGGLVIAAHVDRPSFSVTSQLGMLPADIVFDALEISAAGRAAGRAEDFVQAGPPLVTFSDAHFVEAIGSVRTLFYMAAPTFDEIVLCLRGEEGRFCRVA